MKLSSEIESKLIKLGKRLIDQELARCIVLPQRSGTGHWFGGGNIARDVNGKLWLVGRYRNQGDSRTGLGMGERGLELAIFSSSDNGQNWAKEVSLQKRDLNVGDQEVLSIEGTALRFTDHGVELYLSTEKTGIGYPDPICAYLKPGTGVWTIDRISADCVKELPNARIETVLASDDPQFVQVKDPFLFKDGNTSKLLFCTHPFCWSSSNTGYAEISPANAALGTPVMDFFPRGFTWDVAMTRGTAILDVPATGCLQGHNISLFFYDGGECVRDLDEHQSAVTRPRGYSCEELGGLAYFTDHDINSIHRLSIVEPLFVSPYGTGCSRYVDVVVVDDGYLATWQQSQDDGSQPLVANFVSHSEVAEILT